MYPLVGLDGAVLAMYPLFDFGGASLAMYPLVRFGGASLAMYPFPPGLDSGLMGAPGLAFRFQILLGPPGAVLPTYLLTLFVRCLINTKSSTWGLPSSFVSCFGFFVRSFDHSLLRFSVC